MIAQRYGAEPEITFYDPPVLDERLTATLQVSEEFLAREVAEQRTEARRRVAAYRGDRPPPEVAGRDVVVADDGIATGATVHVARRIAERVPSGDIVCLFADGGWKYLSTEIWTKQLEEAAGDVEYMPW